MQPSPEPARPLPSVSPDAPAVTVNPTPQVAALWLRAAVVVLAACLPYLACLGNPWIWDDSILLAQRLAPENTSGWVDIWRQPYWGKIGLPDTYRPLSLSLIYLERLAFGGSEAPREQIDDGVVGTVPTVSELETRGKPLVAAYHVVSLLLHATVSLLVMAVIGRLAGARVGWLCALLFAVHPIHAEAVAMVYGQLELCAALFTLSTIWFYTQARQDKLKPVPFALAILMAFAAACSKESALMLPALLLLVRAVWMSGDGDLASRAGRFKRGLGWDVLFLLPVLAYLLLRHDAMGSLAPNPEATISQHYSLGQRVKAVVVSVGHALRLCSVPSGQTLYYGHLRDSVFGWPVNELIWIVFAMGVLVWLVGRLGGWSALFGALWFALTLLPVANLVPTGVLVAERTLYTPSLGICFLIAAVFSQFTDFRRFALLGLLVASAVMASATVSTWHDEETLWRTTVAAHPRSPMGQMWLGGSMIKRWRKTGIVPGPEELRKAAEAFAIAHELNPELKQAQVGSAYVAHIQRTGQLPPVEK